MRDLEDRLVDQNPAFAVFDFHDPDIRIDANLLGEIFGGARLVGSFPDWPRPDALLAAPRRAQHGAGAVEPVDLDERGDSFFGSTAHKISLCAGDFAAANQGLDIDRAFEPDHGSLPIGTNCNALQILSKAVVRGCWANPRAIRFDFYGLLSELGKCAAVALIASTRPRSPSPPSCLGQPVQPRTVTFPQTV